MSTNKLKIHKTKIGFSLVEMMASLGLGSLVLLGLMQLNIGNEKAIRNSNKYSQIDFYTALGSNLLANRAACKETLGGFVLSGDETTVHSFGNIKSAAGRDILINGQAYGISQQAGANENNITLNITLENVVKTVATVDDETQDTFAGVVKFTWSSTGGNNSKRIEQERIVNVYGAYDNSGGTDLISGCASDYISSVDAAKLAFCEKFLVELNEVARSGDPNNSTNVTSHPAAPGLNIDPIDPMVNDGNLVSNGDPTNCWDAFATSNFAAIRERLRDRVCVDMGGTVSGAGCDFSNHYASLSCANGALVGFTSDGQTPICRTFTIGSSGGSGNSPCILSSDTQNWGSCSAVVSATIPHNDTLTVDNTRTPASLDGELVLACDNGNLSVNSQSCNPIATQCDAETVTWGDAGNCSKDIGNTSLNTNVGSVNNTAPGFTGTADILCNANGDFVVSNPVCNAEVASGEDCINQRPRADVEPGPGTGGVICDYKGYPNISLNNGEEQSNIYMLGECWEHEYGRCFRKWRAHALVTMVCDNGRLKVKGQDEYEFDDPGEDIYLWDCRNDAPNPCGSEFAMDACGECFNSSTGCSSNYCQGNGNLRAWAEAGGRCNPPPTPFQ